MAQTESPPAGLPPESINRIEFIAELEEHIHIPAEALARLRSTGVRRVLVSLLADERLQRLSARGIELATADAVAAILGVQLSVAVEALLAEGAAEGGFAARLRALAGGPPA